MVATHTKRMVRQCCLRIWCLFFVLAILFASAIVYAVDGDDDAGSNGASAEEETNPKNRVTSSFAALSLPNSIVECNAERIRRI